MFKLITKSVQHEEEEKEEYNVPQRQSLQNFDFK